MNFVDHKRCYRNFFLILSHHYTLLKRVKPNVHENNHVWITHFYSLKNVLNSKSLKNSYLIFK